MVIVNMSGIYGGQDFGKNFSDIFADCSDLEETLYFCSDAAAASIRERIRGLPAEDIHFIDSGDYHYLTLFWLEKLEKPFSLLVFDHHSDCMESAFGGDILTCGSWVLHACRTIENLKQVILVGPADEDGTALVLEKLEKVTWIREEELTDRRGELIELLNRYPVYISLDKDVLTYKEAVTDWSQGNMTLSQIFDIVGEVRTEITGADICGELKMQGCIDEEAQKINDITNSRVSKRLKALIGSRSTAD